jgi:hypothetical protein
LRPGGGGYDLARNAQTPGFGGSKGLTLNGTARVSQDKKIELTDNPIPPNMADEKDHVGRAWVPTFQAGSVFGTQPVDVTDFRTRFTILLRGIDANNMADGFTFTVQAVGPDALGSSGSGLGYATDPFDQTHTGARIPRSLAIAFNIVDNTVSVWRDGTKGGPWTHDLGTSGIALNSGHAIMVDVAFDTLARTVVINVGHPNAAIPTTGPLQVQNIDLPTFLKLGTPPRAFIGITAGTGAKSAEQTILDWTVKANVVA